MKIKIIPFLFVFWMNFLVNTTMAQTSKVLHVSANKPTGTVQPTMWGVFFEDINFGADGGIYAELIKNRSFEFFKPLMGWKIEQKPFIEGAVTVLNRNDINTGNPRYLSVNLKNATKGSLAIINEGFRGMGIKKDLQYTFSLQYQSSNNAITIHVELLNEANETIGSTVFSPLATNGKWEKQTVQFTSKATSAKATCKIWFEGSGTIKIDMVSLFPEDTWKKRPGGMRADMIQLLADMKPGFLRFPGGCIVEGFDLSQRYQWKKTIGPIENRQLIINRWNFEFAHRPAPDYFQTFGLGFYEYFQLAEDIGAAPLPILNCGMACQFNSAELVPIDQIDPYVQDALDLIEFANGAINSIWGKIRAEMGHPQPFNLTMIGIGNENWGPQYIERLKIFQKAIKENYPYIKLITSAGTDPDGARFDALNTTLRSLNVDFIDEHYYRKPEWFIQNVRRYDNYPRNNVKVFAGEYAAQSDKTVSVNNKNNWLSALSEAAFMTGLERNADVVQMASYAPLFAHADAWQWTPDLIWVDNLRAYGTTDYYVQQLFSVNKGNRVLPITLNNDVVAGQDSLFASAVLDTITNQIILKIVNLSANPQKFSITFDGIKKQLNAKGQILLMQNNNLNAVNSFEKPQLIAPIPLECSIKNKKLDYESPGYSFQVIKILTK
ncbi:MAG: alpha-L-arabinofuranosidase [Chitinophagaceae bacterium]|nr:alpha-L-arabinofuranosidase [Chitinophagaceae bacterium]